MMPTLQKRPKFGIKMAKSQSFMNQFPPNHHRMLFLVHRNHSVKLKEKNEEILGLKVMIPTLQKWPKFGMKMAKSRSFMDQYPPNKHIISFLFHENHSVKLKEKN